MKKDNPLSLWRFAYKPSYYVKHPFKWIKDIYWNFRNFIHRGRYGYAYTDVWNWCSWFPTVGAEALRYLAKHGDSYPSVSPWETPKKWKSYLMEMANNLEWCRTCCEIAPAHHEKQNQYFQAMNEMRKRHPIRRLDATENDIALIKKYWDREEELSKQDIEECVSIFSEIGKNLGRFWD